MGIFRLLLYGALLWLLYRFVRGLLPGAPRGGGGEGGAPAGGRLQGGELVQDPVCGVYIPKETALRGPGGEYFCSQACRDARRGRA
ncbi:MAG: TRASH domain protein [Deferrisomatales bacterium]